MSNSETEALSKTESLESAKRQTSESASTDPQRFANGVLVKGKFIGCEDVKEETGDEVCATSMIKLKAVVIAKKEHKQRIIIKVNLEGIEIFDEKNSVSMYKHSVNRISYIARDINDSRAIGYIYKNSANSFQYFAIKTERQAQEFFNTLKDLFEAVLELRNSKKNESPEKTPTTHTSIVDTQIQPPALTFQKSVNLLDGPSTENASSLFDFSKNYLLTFSYE